MDACPDGAIRFTREYRLASRDRRELVVTGAAATARALELGDELRTLFGRSLKLRVVSAGGCNGCESDVAVLGTVVFDLARFGIQFVASPRHADGLLVTGPVTENMRVALHKTYEAVPEPKIVIAVGACAISGGPYAGHPEAHDGADTIVPVDLYVPGCPPHPYTILEGLLGLIGRRGKHSAVELGSEPAWVVKATEGERSVPVAAASGGPKLTGRGDDARPAADPRSAADVARDGASSTPGPPRAAPSGDDNSWRLDDGGGS
jgi:Ni,Fe-hydrogenase III small subunit